MAEDIFQKALDLNCVVKLLKDRMGDGFQLCTYYENVTFASSLQTGVY